MSEKVFVTKEIEVIKGVKAAPLIQAENELKNFEEGVGVIKIDKSRWAEAQHYERKTWCDSASKVMITDRNEEHLKNFDNYKALSAALGDGISVIELGCGPYTNMRFILPCLKRKVDSVHLLDPLINDYILNSPNCTYANGRLGSHPVTTFCTPIEEFKASRWYDLVVMINVLDHCFNIDLIFKKISGMLKKGGVLVINERAYRDGLKQSLENIYDAGHPIRISEKYLDGKLMSYRVLYSNELIINDIVDKYLILQK